MARGRRVSGRMGSLGRRGSLGPAEEAIPEGRRRLRSESEPDPERMKRVARRVAQRKKRK